MPISAALARKLSEIDPPLREAMLLLVEEVEKQREQMAQQVTKAEFQELQGVVRELVVSVKRLTEAQARTEAELWKLTAEHRVTRKRLERIVVDYMLADQAMKALPAILARQGIRVEGRLVRRYVYVRKKERQLNIFGHGRRNGERVLILGEAKVRPSRQEVDRFVRLAQRVAEQEGMPATLVFVAHDFPPAIEAHIKNQGILPVWSYELE